MGNLTFDELGMLNEFQKAITKAFEVDESKPDKYWYKLFGNKKVNIYDSFDVDKPKFPCFVVTLYPRMAVSTITSSESERFSFVNIEIEQYNQRVGDIDKRTLGIMINNRLKSYLQEKYNILTTYNQQLLSPDPTIYRRLIRAEIVYDNKNQIIYQGE